jgi:hypothetical protein
VLRAGNFSSMAPGQVSVQQYPQQDRTVMYRKAFELAKTNALDGELEIKN